MFTNYLAAVSITILIRDNWDKERISFPEVKLPVNDGGEDSTQNFYSGICTLNCIMVSNINDLLMRNTAARIMLSLL